MEKNNDLNSQIEDFSKRVVQKLAESESSEDVEVYRPGKWISLEESNYPFRATEAMEIPGVGSIVRTIIRRLTGESFEIVLDSMVFVPGAGIVINDEGVRIVAFSCNEYRTETLRRDRIEKHRLDIAEPYETEAYLNDVIEERDKRIKEMQIRNDLLVYDTNVLKKIIDERDVRIKELQDRDDGFVSRINDLKKQINQRDNRISGLIHLERRIKTYTEQYENDQTLIKDLSADRDAICRALHIGVNSTKNEILNEIAGLVTLAR